MKINAKIHPIYNILLGEFWLSEEGDSTVVLMCALVLLMMAFFAVLNSISVKDKKRERAALGSVTESFGALPGGVLPDAGKQFLLASPPMVDPQHELASKGISPETLYELVRLNSDKKWYQIITLKKSLEGLSIALSDQGFFTPGRAELAAEKLPMLNKISALIQDSSCDVIIKGYTDNTPIASSNFGSNWELSAARAMNVMKYFIQQGISPSRLEAAGYGEYDPLFPNDTEEHRALNRRVEIQLVQKEKKELPSRDDSNDKDGIMVHGFWFKMRSLMQR